MNWDTITSTTSCPSSDTGGGAGNNCANPDFALANPTLCGVVSPTIILRPEYALKEPAASVQYSTFALVNDQEMDVSRDTTYAIANASVATIDTATGEATTVAPGITTVSASWNGLLAYAQLEVVADCSTVPFTFLLLFDVSKSMGLLYGGPFPTKLSNTQHAANSFIDAVDFDLHSVIVGSFDFTGSASFTGEITSATAAHTAVNALVPTTQVTDLGDGITRAIAEFPANHHKSLILFSDGENKLGVDPVAVASSFQALGNLVTSYGVRSYNGGLTLLRAIADGGFWVNSFPIDGVANEAESAFLALLSHICGECTPLDDAGYGTGCSPDPQVADPNPPPDLEDYPPHWTSTQSFTATCGELDGGPLTRTATYTSYISQDDADAQALALATTQAEADIICGTVDLDGSRWSMPCVIGGATNLCTCADPSDVVSVLTGNPLTTYNVTLRIRGVVELSNYDGGTNDTHFFQTGGTPPDGSPYNTYAIVIENPAQTYYVNRSWAAPDGQNYVYPMDYNVTIPVVGASHITLQARARDGVQLTNKFDITIPDVDSALNHGQFVQVDVVSIA